VSGATSTVKPEAPKMGAKQRAMVLGFAAVIVGVAVWGLTACNRDGDPSSASTEVSMVSGDARIVSEDDLSGLTSDVGHQVFWAGPQADTQLEFSSDDTGNVHLRYLTGGADAGDPNQSFLNIGSYPFAGAYAATRKLANGPNVVKVTEHGGVGFYDPANPYSVIIAWPNQPDLQVEVYDPEKNRALEFVRSGDIVPVS
ncbi:MAG TPA: hypothetical protein P5138_07280, partial [Solirubrobacterales bacterium]|nr:hypothetical protein [Solirubrobacterales bacterium]